MTLYQLFSLIGILAGLLAAKFIRMPKTNTAKDWTVYAVAFLGLVVGAKLPVWISYGFSEGSVVSGRSFLGGILGAFVAIHLYKWLTKRGSETFGGRFVIPLAIAAGFGKIGCFFNGCCGGEHAPFPPQLGESAFQFLMAGVLYLFYKKTNRADLLFPVYLLAYLVMRFFMEFLRCEPRVLFDLTIYQWLALLFAPVVAYILRKRLPI